MDPIVFVILPIWLASMASIPVIIITATLLTRYIDKRKLVMNEGAIEMPEHKGIMVIRGDRFPLDLQAEALSKFIKEFNKRFPEKPTWWEGLLGMKSLVRAKKGLIVEWVDGDYFWSRDKDNQEFPEGHKWRSKVYGQFVGGKRIVTAARNHVNPPMNMGQTAYIHELTHWALKVMTGNADAGHATGDQTSTWTDDHSQMISDVNLTLK